MERIPLIRPFFDAEEIKNLKISLSSGRVSGDGPFSKKAICELKKILKSRFLYLTPSCTHSLEMAMMTLGIKAGEEVILPSFTFVSTANVVLRQNAHPVFADIEPQTLNISADDIERKITKRTRAIIVIHYAGVSCDMDRILKTAKKYKLWVVEDAAHCLDAYYKGRHLGTIGDIGCISFHETKNLTCGEGGLFITDKEKLAHRAEIIREKGTDRTKFLRGEVDKYTWRSVGSSFLLSDILSSVLLAQVKKIKKIRKKRQEIFNFYIEKLKPLEKKGFLKLPYIPPHCKTNYHIFYILLPNEKARNYCKEFLNGKGIQAAFHYLPLHLSPYAKKHLGFKKGDLPVTEDLAARLLRLPLYPGLSFKKVEFIIDTLKKALFGL